MAPAATRPSPSVRRPPTDAIAAVTHRPPPSLCLSVSGAVGAFAKSRPQKLVGKNKLVPRLLGVNKECVMRVDEKTKDVLKEWPLEQVRRWNTSPRTFTLDFGDYQDGYYSVQTLDGEKIGQLIAGYIDIIVKKKAMKDHLGIEGDEGSTMLEDVVAPAKATLVAHGQIGAGQYAQDGHVALRGVLRTPQQQPHGYGYGINGAQYGAVSGEIQSQSIIAKLLNVISICMWHTAA
ncbi:hypothetical protein TELCIR_02275 [Teladorsagia circumcincta]|uniref:IRS-type PTB domain-containing protein n=1 Tax=Teladorsagia circumcincta TaxID=45464 RepID=A0A2G9V1P0_TELCI|nr:hypothetical protein TELCIR_02275 [Teladorsagia circumcincta]